MIRLSKSFRLTSLKASPSADSGLSRCRSKLFLALSLNQIAAQALHSPSLPYRRSDLRSQPRPYCLLFSHVLSSFLKLRDAALSQNLDSLTARED